MIFCFCVFFPLWFVLFGSDGWFGPSQHCFSEVEVVLGGVVAFGLFSVKLLAVVFAELKGGGEGFLTLGEGFLEFGDAGLENCDFLGWRNLRHGLIV